MKVLYLVTAYPRTAHDVITPWLGETIHRLRAAGVTVEVLAPAYRGLASQVIDGVKVHRFRYAPASWERLTHEQTAPDRIREQPHYLGLVPSYVVAGSLAAARLARSGRFSLVHAFWPLPHGLLGLAAKRAAGIPLVTTFFGVELTWMRSQLSVLGPVLRRIVRASDAVTVISSYTAHLLTSLVPGVEPHLVPFGATVTPHAPSPSVSRAATRPYTLLFVGRLVERKGVSYLLRAVRQLIDGRSIRVWIVGDGPLRAELEAEARELGLTGIVGFEGVVSTVELERHMDECDVLVLPAVVDAKGDTEGLGVVLIEALSHEKPVIASRVGGISDIVRDQHTGLLVPPADVEALADAIRSYMDQPEMAALHASAGRAHVEECFSWDSIIERLQHIYLTVSRKGKI